MAKDTKARTVEKPPPEAFILYNRRERGVAQIVEKLNSLSVSTFFRTSSAPPSGSPMQQREWRAFNGASTVLMFLGKLGWGPNHLRISEEALRRGKRIIPILIGDVAEEDLEKVGALFRNRSLDLRTPDSAAIAALVEEIRRVEPRAGGGFDTLIGVLVDGNEEERSDALSQVRSLAPQDKRILAARLRDEISSRYGPGSRGGGDWIRDPAKIPSIRSWMLSSLVWADAEGEQSRDVILSHLQSKVEPDNNVRFWTLAGLYQCKAPYLDKAVEICRFDLAPEVASLALAISASNDPKVQSELRSKLHSSEFGSAWQVLRLLRVVPIPELAGDVCALVRDLKFGTPLSYDAIYALSNPAMAHEAGKLLSENPGLEAVLKHVVAESRISNGTASRNFAVLLAEFDPAGIDAALERAKADSESVIAVQRLQKFLEEYRRRINPESIAAPAKGYTFGPAGYTSEFCGVGGAGPVPDYLGVEALAHRLAELMALRETKLPLAIGLFGNWGSGKSHFMNLMDRHMKKLANEAEKDWASHAAEPDAQVRSDPNGDGPWCREIVPVYFNAWHYIDTNLWASLVSQIFESLFAHLRPKQDDLANVQKLLEQAAGATARAVEEVALAHTATERAKNDLQIARENRRGEETLVNGMLESLQSLLPEVSREDLQNQAMELLNVRKEVKTLRDLKEILNEAKSVKGRIQALWHAAWKREGRGWRAGWLFVSLSAALLLVFVSARVIPAIESWIHRVGEWIVALLAGVPAFVAWLSPIVKEVGRRLGEVENWEKRAEDAQKLARETPLVKKAEANVVAATAVEESAKMRLAEAEAREKRLREEERSLSPERRLGRFIEQRAQSSDYRGQLGLVSLARRDFQELSNIFADAEALTEKVKKLQGSDRPDKRQEAEQIIKLSKSIDRIILFVDDLDRCQPEKVVDVLQAVHLLLAFPLFGVVVGVDQRCLKQSLGLQFKGLLSSNSDQNNRLTGDGEERQATPLDYLEKIFHVPFHLPDMDEPGFSRFVEKLTEPPVLLDESLQPVSSEPEKTSDISLQHGRSNVGIEGPKVIPAADTVIPSPDEPPKALDEVTPPELHVGTRDALQPEEAEKLRPSADLAVARIPELRVIGSVPLHRWERDALKAYHPLIRTPRGATRLLNTYRLVRAGIPKLEWNTFQGDEQSRGEFRVAMLLLASAAGYPAMARSWFEILRNADPTALFLSDANDKGKEWLQFKVVYNSTFAHTGSQPTKELFAKWIDRIERFAF